MPLWGPLEIYQPVGKIKQEKIEAPFTDGVAKICMPKAKEAKLPKVDVPYDAKEEAATSCLLLWRSPCPAKYAYPACIPLGGRERRQVGGVGGNWGPSSKCTQETRYDGKWVLRTNTDLSVSEVALKYKQLWTVESLFRTIQSVLATRPIYHKIRTGASGCCGKMLQAVGAAMPSTIRRVS